MKLDLTTQQRALIRSLASSSANESKGLLEKLDAQNLAMADIEELCNLLNNEFMLEGILPSFEPNAYGLELEALLDVINSSRTKS